TMKQEADALFELSCTSWTDIEEELTRALKTSARFGLRKNLRRIGEKNGFMSVCCMLRPDWTTDCDFERARLPSKIVYKFTCSDQLETVAQSLIGCNLNEDVIYTALRKSNNTEGLFYSLLTPSTADWLQVPGPLCYKEISDDGDVGHLMIEHIEGTSFDCYEHCSIPEVEQIISVIARLQCLSSKENMHRQEEFGWNPWKTIGLCVLTKSIARKVIADIPAFYGGEFEPLIRKLLFALDDLYDLDAPMREHKLISSVLVHGDIWQSNLMWRYGSERPRQLKSILDWQSAHVGSPAEDIAFLLICIFSGEDRRTHWRSLLVFLYRSIEREMAPSKPSFSLDELFASYIRLFPLFGLIVLMRFSVIFKCSLPSLSPEERVKFTHSMSRKLFFLAEDVVASLGNCKMSLRKTMSLPPRMAECRSPVLTMKQEADALFELSCTSWTEVEEELTRALKTSAQFGPRKNLRRIGENNGFMSVCCILRPDWTSDCEFERSRLPSKIVYKFSCSDQLEAVAQSLIGCKLNGDFIYTALRKSNNTEGLFYSLLTPSTADWLHVPGPLCYKEISDDGDVGHLMIEHIEGTSFDCYEHCSIPEVEQIITAIARLQCLSSKENMHRHEEFG
ncbi:hypothetical protein PENTCL1PPCAC_3580, partial [Pristionchus entomophagus]